MGNKTRQQAWHDYAERRVLHWLARRNVAKAAGRLFIAEKCQRKAQNWIARLDAAQGAHS